MTSKVFAGHSFRNDLIEAKVFAAVKRFMTNSPTPRYVLRYERITRGCHKKHKIVPMYVIM